MDRSKVLVHFIVDNRRYANRIINHIPRVGDEVRMGRSKFFIVKRIVWIMYEEDSLIERCNIELVKRND